MFEDFDCMADDPRTEYKGHRLKWTRTGRDCVPWNSHVSGRRWPSWSFPEGSHFAAYTRCRKPDGGPGAPWCYVGPHEEDKEECDLPSCRKFIQN